LILLALALVAILGLPANAHPSAVHVFGANFELNGKLFATGDLTCEEGETFILRINIEQEGGYAIGRANGDCTGSPVSWKTGQIRIQHGTVECGPAIARLQAQTQPDKGRLSQSQEINVCRGEPS
jgi:hypothetical protein